MKYLLHYNVFGEIYTEIVDEVLDSHQSLTLVTEYYLDEDGEEQAYCETFPLILISDYKREEMLNKIVKLHNYFQDSLGKNVINNESYWFTSDEQDAFKVIWQRRISA